jgi:transposase
VLITRTPDERLTFLQALASRRKGSVGGGIPAAFTGYLITDGYTGYQHLLSRLAGIQQCAAHVIRRCRAVTKLSPGGAQNWAGDIITILREAHAAVEDARARDSTALDQQVLDNLRERYDTAVSSGIIHNRLRAWHEGNHPGYSLGCWLREYKEQAFLFTRVFAVSWTNDLASHCTSWVRSAAPGFSRWSGRVAGVVLSIACGTDIFRQRAAEVGVVAAS